jgi:putative effector of murein hydrolase LrgA (UPF0299 family)
MIGALATLLLAQLAGETIARGLSLPVPGPVLGLVMLALWLWFDLRRRGASDDSIETTDIGRVATMLIANLGLLFVPAGAGVVQQMRVLGDHGVAIVVALVVSTVLTLLATVAIFRLAKRNPAGRDRV